MPLPFENPLLSIVAASRNDDHGGDPPQASWAEQLEYARNHVIRENTMKGSVSVSVSASVSASRFDGPSAAPVKPIELEADAHFMDLHLIACGDFTLLGKQAWDELRGYPEFDCYSMHLDSVLCCQAHYAGYLQHFLPPPAVAFHIEHSLGSGWTPEGEVALFGRLHEEGLRI